MIRRPSGFSLIESVLSLALLGIGLTGIGAMQITAARVNSLGLRTADASRLAADLIESVSRWDYGDPRLTALSAVATVDDDEVTLRWDLGREAVVPSERKPQYAENEDDDNASNAAALGVYQGLTSDVDGDGEPDYARYWTVFEVGGRGKLVQVVVRWKQPGMGYKQVVHSTFKPDPAAVLQ